jgi:hypothetical protein
MTLSIRQRPLAVLAATVVCSFLLIVLVEHLANPALDPATHQVSEYVHAQLGWLMTCGFVLWALSIVVTAVVVSDAAKGRALAGALLIAAVGMGVTACFATQTSAGHLPPGVSHSTTGRLHDIGSGLASAALIAAVLLSLRLRGRPTLRKVTMTLVAVAGPATVLLLVLGSEVAGIRQRLLILTACVWQVALLLSDYRPALAEPATDASPPSGPAPGRRESRPAKGANAD